MSRLVILVTELNWEQQRMGARDVRHCSDEAGEAIVTRGQQKQIEIIMLWVHLSASSNGRKCAVIWCHIPLKPRLCRCRWLSLNTPVLIKRCNVEPPSSPALQQLPTEVFSISSVSFSRPRRGLETNFINWYLQLSVHQTMDFILLAKHTTHLDTSSCKIWKILYSSYRNQAKFWTYRWINTGGASKEGLHQKFNFLGSKTQE